MANVNVPLEPGSAGRRKPDLALGARAALPLIFQEAEKSTARKAPVVDVSETSALTKAWESAASAAKNLTAETKETGAAVPPVSGVSVDAQKALLRQLYDAQKRQAADSIDRTVRQNALQLRTAQQDAAAQFQTMRDQTAADEVRALDNQALYAEARGDRGGLGQAQYGAIRNAAAANRLAVNLQQVKLSTDTERQIEQLRAQGEFDKADKLLGITQEYLKELMALEKWAAEKNLGAEEFNNQLARWQADYDLSVRKYLTDTELDAAQLLGVLPDGTPIRTTRSDINGQLAETGMAMLKKGLMPTDEQLAAMGMTRSQAAAYIY